MTMWKICICLGFIGAVLCEDVFNETETGRIRKLSILPNYQALNFKRVAERILNADKLDRIAEINDYVDALLSNLNKYIAENGLSTLELPGIEGKIDLLRSVLLTEGQLYGLDTIERKGDAIVRYQYPNLKIHLVLGFTQIAFDYHYEVKVIFLEPQGSAIGKVIGSKFTTDLELNMVNLRARLETFNFDTLGDVSLKFTDGGILGNTVNILIKVVIPLLKPILRVVLSSFITIRSEKLIDTYNNAVCTFLDDCPEENQNV